MPDAQRKNYCPSTQVRHPHPDGRVDCRLGQSRGYPDPALSIGVVGGITGPTKRSFCPHPDGGSSVGSRLGSPGANGTQVQPLG